MVGMLRVGVPDYPERALREALANAFLHRDYQRLGAVYFQWQTNHIEITSPGGFPEGVRLDNLLVTTPRPRNPLLADAFKRAGIVERTARGIDTIFYDQLPNGRPAPSFERSNEATVSIVVPGGDADLEFVRMLVNEAQRRHDLGLDELLILHALRQTRSLASDDLLHLLQKPEKAADAALSRLIEAGLIETRGQMTGRAWQLSRAAYRPSGEKPVQVPKRGFGPRQQEQMVLKHVEMHGRITRREAAELCRITGPQAYRLLYRISKQGLVQRDGQRGRNVSYGLTQNQAPQTHGTTR